MQTRGNAIILSVITVLVFTVAAANAEDYSEWYVKAQNEVTVGNYATAVRYYDNAIALNSRYAPAFAGKAVALNNLGRFDESITVADTALAIKTDPVALNARADALFALNRYAEAVEAYDLFFTYQDNIAKAYCNQGEAYVQLGQDEQGIASFEDCVRLDAKNIGGWNQMGIVLLSLGRYQEALDSFTHATQVTTSNAEVWNNKGLAYAGLENYNKALDCFKMALDLDPAFTEAKTNLDKAYLRKPFFTQTATQAPLTTTTAVTTRITTAAPPVITSEPAPVLTEVTMAHDVTAVQTKTTYAPLSPFITLIGLIAGMGLTLLMVRRE